MKVNLLTRGMEDPRLDEFWATDDLVTTCEGRNQVQPKQFAELARLNLLYLLNDDDAISA